MRWIFFFSLWASCNAKIFWTNHTTVNATQFFQNEEACFLSFLGPQRLGDLLIQSDGSCNSSFSSTWNLSFSAQDVQHAEQQRQELTQSRSNAFLSARIQGFIRHLSSRVLQTPHYLPLLINET